MCFHLRFQLRFQCIRSMQTLGFCFFNLSFGEEGGGGGGGKGDQHIYSFLPTHI